MGKAISCHPVLSSKEEGIVANMGTTSVIIPAYNAEGTLAAAVESVLKLSPSVIECIVVDDCSTDNTREIARASGAKVICLAENSGPGIARNIGAKEAKGEFLAFTDSDCIVPVNWLQEFHNHYDGGNYCGITGPYCGPVNSTLVTCTIDRWTHYNQQDIQEVMQACSSANLFVSRKDFLSIGGFPKYKLPGEKRYYFGNEDEEFAHLLSIQSGKNFLWLKTNGVYHDYRNSLCQYFKQHSLWTEAIMVSLARFPGMRKGNASNYSSVSSLLIIAWTWLLVGSSLLFVYLHNPYFLFPHGLFLLFYRRRAFSIYYQSDTKKGFITKIFRMFYAYFFILFTALAWTKGIITGSYKFMISVIYWKFISLE